ncbi:MAG: aspartate--tRNA ligase [Candidatus Buchananbacteria bacterium CG10_big_fil_rev_8_21_14_0_10_42_9]|uniref:Aspartate--tRNA ligase n=1 Tax=Candidatus Buchananbacteria bacterium CG10_big_fil_rev_8_21_14_0_10_42_9 TaxID=1974526 RepID=A0A2H0W248_9BACT|nr:MAG: aspartate--tRNA ligase [Candidatus Buchananbacteria bacterium CG10_big_fil_rev_8_21_14_0_10_42_9]
MERILTENTTDKIDQTVTVAGWVAARRDMGKIIFLDIRDRTGILQVVFSDDHAEALRLADTVRPEFCIKVIGLIKKRGERQINKNIPTGTVEMEAHELEILNPSKTTPFEIEGGSEAGEETRLRYRYLDLRRARPAANITLRHKVIKFIRGYLDEQDFREIETPYLTKGTPEGAREFIVPSRNFPGEFYVLPQSPQQFKELLMVAGVERYFQIVRCFRDEDQRGDRQAEFTQLDLEMSFVEQEDVMDLIEKLVIALVEKITPDKKISKKPFPRLTYGEAMAKHKSDRPDMRKNKDDENELAFCWVTDFPMFEIDDDKNLNAKHHPFTKPQERDINVIQKDPLVAKAHAYDLVLNGQEVAGGSIRIHDAKFQKQILQLLGLTDEEITSQFGHLIEALEYGAPPLGGIAFGLDRLIMVLANEPNIREVIPFPKTSDNRDLTMGAPSTLSDWRLKEVHVRIDKEE